MSEALINLPICPIGFECIPSTNRFQSSYCWNRSYCENVTKPWNLPYIYGIADNNSKILKVRFAFGQLSVFQNRQLAQELALIGFAIAWRLPFEFFRTEADNKALVVINPCLAAQEAGWQEAFELGGEFHTWCLAKSSATYSEYENRNSIEFYTDHWIYYQHRYYPAIECEFFHDQVDDIPF